MSCEIQFIGRNLDRSSVRVAIGRHIKPHGIYRITFNSTESIEVTGENLLSKIEEFLNQDLTLKVGGPI